MTLVRLPDDEGWHVTDEDLLRIEIECLVTECFLTAATLWMEVEAC